MKNYEVPEIQDDIISLDAKTALRISKANSREEFENILEQIKAAAEKGETYLQVPYKKNGTIRLLIDAGFKVEHIEPPGFGNSENATTIIGW